MNPNKPPPPSVASHRTSDRITTSVAPPPATPACAFPIAWIAQCRRSRSAPPRSNGTKIRCTVSATSALPAAQSSAATAAPSAPPDRSPPASPGNPTRPPRTPPPPTAPHPPAGSRPTTKAAPPASGARAHFPVQITKQQPGPRPRHLAQRLRRPRHRDRRMPEQKPLQMIPKRPVRRKYLRHQRELRTPPDGGEDSDTLGM